MKRKLVFSEIMLLFFCFNFPKIVSALDFNSDNFKIRRPPLASRCEEHFEYQEQGWCQTFQKEGSLPIGTVEDLYGCRFRYDVPSDSACPKDWILIRKNSSQYLCAKPESAFPVLKEGACLEGYEFKEESGSYYSYGQVEGYYPAGFWCVKPSQVMDCQPGYENVGSNSGLGQPETYCCAKYKTSPITPRHDLER